MKRGHNIDKDFAKAMELIGGQRPSEINPACADGENADVVLTADQVIIEVKTLMEDSRDKADFDKTYSAMHAKWVSQGKVAPQKGKTLMLNTAALPEKCAHELIGHLTNRIAGNVKKSNRQIEALKETLHMPEAKGILVLCNTGNAFLQPDVILYALHHRFQRDLYSSIDWVIYMTYELPVKLQNMPFPADVFVPCVRDGGVPMPKDLLDRIRDAWMRHVSTGGVVTEFAGEPKDILGVRHVGMAAPSPKK